VRDLHLLDFLGFGRSVPFACRLRAVGMAIGLAATATLAPDFASAPLVRPVSAQESPRVFITVAPLTHAAPASKTQLSIQVGPQGVVPQNSFIRVRGLPPFVGLSDGYTLSAGSWAVPLPAARQLAVIVPAGTQGRSEIAIDVVKVDGSVLAQTKTVLVITSASEHTKHQHVETAAIALPEDPSPLAAIQKGFDAFLAKSAPPKGEKRRAASALTIEQKAEMFRQFLTWPQNPLKVDVNVRTTSTGGAGELIGTLTVGNTEIMVAGRKEAALLLKPNLKGLRPGLYAFHVHENANCGAAAKDGELVPGMAAGSHLWLSGTGQLSGTTFTSHLGNLPHLEADADGTATKPVVAARLTLADVANRSLMIHATQDDYSARLACGRLN
jgi:superoxide dismutase, Cu-Zn family